MYNPKWDRWIFASTSKYFYDACNASIPMYIEGQDYTKFGDLPEKAEFRLIGPNSDEVSKNYFKLTCEINIVVKVFKDKDFHKKDRLAGIIQQYFHSIPLKMYGDGENLIDCLQLKGPVEKLDLGEFNKVIVCTLNANYEVFLQGTT